MPEDLKWKKLKNNGDVPTPRSGHSFTHVGGFNYLLYGGIDNSKKGSKILPSNDVYAMKIGTNEVTWYKEKFAGDQLPPARTQHIAISTPKHDKIFVFGGHSTPQVRLNDTWFLTVQNLTWKRAEGDEPATPKNQDSISGAPAPRANTGATIVDNKVYIFGGHGGVNYARVAFNDIYSFDLDTHQWEKIEYANNPPEPRGGHTLFSIGRKIYCYGGWNSETQYNNIIVFNLDTLEWYDPDIYNDIPRWNHSAIMVEAIPSWKYFIFGGETGDFPEGGPRNFGNCTNTACYLDIETMHWTTMQPEDVDAQNKGVMPPPREYSAMAYDHKDSRLLVFGGWNNGWFNDLYALNVSKIVGPSYAITDIIPGLGQLSGNVPVSIQGVGFKDANIKIYFTCGKNPVDLPSKQSVEVTGIYVSETELSCVTPSYEQFGPKDAIVQLSIQGGDLTTTWSTFSYFMNTRAYKSLAYGPGLLPESAVGHETEFIIQARNDSGENRRSGRDNFQVKITALGPEPKDVSCQVIDKDDGQYVVKYMVEEEVDCKIEILFEDDKGKMVALRGSPYKSNFSAKSASNVNNLTGPAMGKYIATELEQIHTFISETIKGASTKDKNIQDVKTLISVKDSVDCVFTLNEEIVLRLDCLDESLRMFQEHQIAKDSQLKQIKRLFDDWVGLKKLAKDIRKEISPLISNENEKTTTMIKKFEEDLKVYTTELKKRDFYYYKTGVVDSKKKLGSVGEEIAEFDQKLIDYGYNAQKFGNPDLISNSIKQVDGIKGEIQSMVTLWDHIDLCQNSFSGYMEAKWIDTNPFDMEEEVKGVFKTLKEMKVDKRCNAYSGIQEDIKRWLVFLPLISELRDEAMRPRHWKAIKDKVQKDFEVNDRLLLKDVYNLNLNKYQEDVEEITDQARQESKMEKTLVKLEETWKDIVFEFNKHKDTDVMLIRLSEENFEMLEENQVNVTAMFSSRYLSTFEDKCVYWQKSLAAIAEIVQLLAEVQRSWSFLENLFIHSEEVKKELPKESEKFVGIDKEVKAILRDGEQKQKALIFSTQETVMARLEEVQKQLTLCEKALNDFMDSKRRAFPRFYFVSPADLLDILSNGNNPNKIMVHMPKIFQAIETLHLKEDGERPQAIGMETCVGKEYVEFSKPLKLVGKVENYLGDVIDTMRGSLAHIGGKSVQTQQVSPKEDWIKQDPSQITLIINLCVWVRNVETAFHAIKATPGAMKKAFDDQVISLTGLIKMVQGDLDRGARQKIMCLITMDAHSRDIIEKLIVEKVYESDEFQWQSQLKSYFDPQKCDFRLKIADAEFWYGWEYLGNGPRLVVTPLTDRIYVTATQALHLKMGCAPAGPAGTGKTETTKDLASSMGKACYVFNCSDQMDYKGMGGIFKGLAASGSWGCFDEFNRLVPEVLSVCSVQFKSVTDAIKQKKERFLLQEDEINLDPTCGVFITMNPGYLGRSELPEGLKALFRPITVVVPDLELICENMLMAEGFVNAKILAKKFTTLYSLCRDLLSKQSHYDWGLRAIKSVLVVAGAFKRAEPQLLEQALLMRALRDFNIPKIVADDLDIFFGLLGDLFPGIDVPRKRDERFESIIRQAASELGYFDEPEFILKIVQLGELLEIRHCVFVMGNPGSGKSATWKTLAKAQDKDNKKTTVVDLDPKVVSTNELYGVVLLATREWKDGLLSKTMRSLSQLADNNPKWIVLDGDLDANWIESMNSVMDDNKILTLASNERIVLKPHMRMIFEIRDLRFATPATVSRAGILFISDSFGYQWRSFQRSWITMKKYNEETKVMLQQLFDKYIPETLLHVRKSFKYLVPAMEISIIISLCKLLESIMDKQEVKGIEFVFVFACVWCIGGGFSEKDGHDYRKEFSNWWKDKWKTIKFPNKGTVFDYYVDIENTKLEEWSKMQTKDIEKDIDTSKSISNYTVPTVDTISAQFLMKQFITVDHSPMLVGNAGCGKTQISKGLLNDLTTTTDQYIQQIVNFNYYTDSMLLQTILEQQLEKKAGKTYAPVGKFKLIYFIDDLNMPELDPYNTQTAISLVRQHKDYEHWYDRNKLQLKDIKNTQYTACMNPTAGSFQINPRLQRHFWTLAIPFPEQTSLFTIYNTFLSKHFSKFKGTIQEQVVPIIKTALNLHAEVDRNFRKTAVNFHYEFNVRHLTNIFQGLLVAKPEAIKEPDNLIKLWIHESERIYGDRLSSQENIATYKFIVADLVKKSFSKYNLTKYFQGANPEPLIFAQFVSGLEEKLYDQFSTIDALAERLQEALREYNDTNPVMDLVLFEDAMKHVCRITRIIAADGGHALLVGVGGSGKQSLSKLSSFICMYLTTTIMISSTYGLNDLKTDLQIMYNKAGLKDEGIMFLLTEGQITNERFLVFINDLLSSGEIADLFATEDKDTIVNNIRPAVKGAGIIDNKDNCWNYYIQRVKKNLHMCLCFSPVGESFRSRSRKFPALVNCTVIDWFHPWPEDALLSVAAKFLADVEMQSDEVRQSITKFMPYSFKTVNEFSAIIFEQERRYVYTTPKSFLELIKLFKFMLSKKKDELEQNKSKYEAGVVKLQETGEIVSKLEEELKVFSVEVEEKKKLADAQAEVVGIEKTKVEAQSSIANAEAEKCSKIKIEVEEESSKVLKDLDEALPLVEKAKEALKGLSLKDFQNLKALKSPPKDIENVFNCVLNLLCTVDSNVPIDKNGKLKTENSWKTSLMVMGNPGALLATLEGFKEKIDSELVPFNNFKAIRGTISDPNFTPAIIKNKSSCAGGLCDWILNITMYYDVFISVEPKKIAVRAAQQKLADANAKKEEMDALVKKLTDELGLLQAEFQKAMDEKNSAEAEAMKCARRLDSAQRLVNALGSESERWSQAIIDLGEKIIVITGDVLLASAFVSYVGPFNKKFRDIITNNRFIDFFKKNKIPMSPDSNPLAILTDEATIAEWNNQKLPADRVSTENGAILTNSERYSLIIDPQLQGITWLKEKEKNNDLQVTRLNNARMVKILEFAIESGQSVLIENMENTIDAVIQPVYSRAIIKKGKSRYIRMGDKELTLHNNFKLFMHTKLSNPHYPPEIQAECALINFTVTEAGLEDQLLALVVKKERPDLAMQKEELIQQQNEFLIKLKQLENDLLFRLATSEGDILENIELIENLEYSKKISIEIKEKVEIAKITEVQINDASEAYRPAASRGALVFFMLNELYKIHSFYKFSLDSFVIVVNRAIDIVAERMNPKKEIRAEGEGEGEEEDEEQKPTEEERGEDEPMTPRTLNKRVEALTESITFEGFNYTRRGLFEKHKLLVATMLCLRILVRKRKIEEVEVLALIKKEVALDIPNQAESLKFIPESAWPAVKGLENVKLFANLISQMESEALQWRKWYAEEKAEAAELPRAFKDVSLFHRLLLLRALRPDRLSGALTQFVCENLGEAFIEQTPFDIFTTYAEMNPQTPVFFVLFPGVDPTPDVERVGKKYGVSIQNGTFLNISMGQGQEEIAVKALHNAGKQGHWIMLQNVHLMQSWLKIFERNLEIVCEDVHPNFRCFVSSEPPGMPEYETIPESILQNSIKVANESPQDLKANIRRAFTQFDEAHFEKAATHKLSDFKALLFGLCMFHSLILGRKKFGSQGWSRNYNFNDGDLQICGDVLHNYLTKYEKVPYDDLRYIYGEIMYGGHITDGWDRRTNNTYLKVLIRPEILNGMQLTCAPGFKSPDPVKFDREAYRKYIEEKLPQESPNMFGLHPNAEIGYLTTQGEQLFSLILTVQGGGSTGGGGRKKEDIVGEFIKKFLETLPPNFSMLDIIGKTKDKSPYIVVCIQECERMNTLLSTLRFSLNELEAGLKGQLNVTDAMEGLANALAFNRVHDSWEKYAYFSKKSLAEWFFDLLARVNQLVIWSTEMVTPKSLWISGLFNPMSFLTAIMQVTAREKQLPLDDMCLRTDVLNTKEVDDLQGNAETGAYVHGFFLEGAGWEFGRGGEQGYLTDMVLKELHPELPVMHVTAVRLKEIVSVGYYECPVYVTTMRGPTYIFTANLKMESDESDANKWILAGVALLQSPE